MKVNAYTHEFVKGTKTLTFIPAYLINYTVRYIASINLQNTLNISNLNNLEADKIMV